MTRNQLHGKKFEDLVKGCGLFPGAADQSRSVTAGIDIEVRFDRVAHLPTSIKTTGSNIVMLSDARRFWAIASPLRMLVGRYRQVTDRKIFETGHEFILLPDDLDALRSGLTQEEVRALHDGVSLAAFPRGQHVIARRWIQKRLVPLREVAGPIILNPKIDSAGQRRLQCSVSLGTLIGLTSPSGRYVAHIDHIGDLALPVTLLSSPRQFGPSNA